MKEKVNVTGVPETMVQTLYARAKETRKKNCKEVEKFEIRKGMRMHCVVRKA